MSLTKTYFMTKVVSLIVTPLRTAENFKSRRAGKKRSNRFFFLFNFLIRCLNFFPIFFANIKALGTNCGV